MSTVSRSLRVRGLQQFRARYLTAEESLRDHGLEFTNHYIMSSACVPSRTSIFTGQYPSLHGESQTPGAAKSSFENDMFWLDQNTVPTMGNYFRAGGYDTYYKGKWHVSDADIHIPGTYDPLLTFNGKGSRIRRQRTIPGGRPARPLRVQRLDRP